MLNVLSLPQLFVNVNVDYYDKEEQAKLEAYPTAAKMRQLVQDGMQIPTHEFLTYYLFYRKRPGKPGYRNYDELGHKYQTALADLTDWIDLNGHSINLPVDVVGQPDNHITERIGESVGLSILNRVHGLTEADWDRIPPKGGRKAPPVFDYQIASDGGHIVQVETKGSVADDNKFKTSAISNHKADIHRKKAKITQLEQEHPYTYPADLRYGTITVIGVQKTAPLSCWLLDPPPEESASDAKRLRILNRIRFLRDWISFVSPRSQLAAALATRVADLISLADPFELDGVSLLKGNLEPFRLEAHPYSFGGHSPFFANKPRVVNGPVGGIVARFSPDALFFLGFREDLLILASEQNFGNITEFKAETGWVEKTVECIVSEGRFTSLQLPEEIVGHAHKYGGYRSFMLKGLLFYNSDGLVFGALPFSQGSKEPRLEESQFKLEAT